jgi:hypothetical protein
MKMKVRFHYPRVYSQYIPLDDCDLDYDEEIKWRRHIGARFDTSFSFNNYGGKLGYVTLSILGFGFQIDWKKRRATEV